MKFLKRLFSGDPTLRVPRFAGILYPRDEEALRAKLEELIEASGPPTASDALAAIVPHSELDFSGRLAVRALARLDDPKRIVLLGPSRRVPFRGVAATACEGFDTPIGWMRVDREAYAPIVDLPTARQLEDAHTAEPSLEVQVPILKWLYPDAALVPLVVGDISVGELATILDRLWGEDTAVVVASELSRGLSADEARGVDAETAAAIASFDVDALDDRELSGRRIVQALLTVAEERGSSAEVLELATSADVGGPEDSTVGYGALVFRRNE